MLLLYLPDSLSVVSHLIWQVCSIEMTMGTLDLATVTLLPNHLQMKESVDLTLFLINHWSLVPRDSSDPAKGVKMVIVLKRKITNELMTTYLPSFLLTIITFATTFFKPIYFEAAVSVNLTTMLVMTTIFIGEMQMLPTTAYIKMIDIWLIFCQLVPFSEVILLTAIEFHRDYDEFKPTQEEQRSKDLDERDNWTPAIAWVSLVSLDFICLSPLLVELPGAKCVQAIQRSSGEGSENDR